MEDFPPWFLETPPPNSFASEFPRKTSTASAGTPLSPRGSRWSAHHPATGTLATHQQGLGAQAGDLRQRHFQHLPRCATGHSLTGGRGGGPQHKAPGKIWGLKTPRNRVFGHCLRKASQKRRVKNHFPDARKQVRKLFGRSGRKEAFWEVLGHKRPPQPGGTARMAPWL